MGFRVDLSERLFRHARIMLKGHGGNRRPFAQVAHGADKNHAAANIRPSLLKLGKFGGGIESVGWTRIMVR